jgi:hypothetical protein
MAVVSTVGKKAAGTALGMMKTGLINNFKAQIEAKAQQKTQQLFEEPGFKAEMSQVLRFDTATNTQWRVRSVISQQMQTWQRANDGEALKNMKSVLEMINQADTRTGGVTKTLISGAMEAGMLARNISVAEGFMDNYINELKRVVHAQAEALKEMSGVVPELGQVKPEVASAWLKALEAEGAIVGSKPYQIQTDADKEGVHPDLNIAMAGVLKASMSVLKMDEVAVKNHLLYQLGARLVQTVHRVDDAHHQAQWVGQLTAAMKGELNSGIGAQVQSMSLSAVSTGVSTLYGVWDREQDELRMKELTSKGSLTANEQEELSSLRGAEYARLDQKHEEDPNSLSAEEQSKLDRYKAQDQAARVAEQRARVEDCHHLTDKKVKGDAMTPEEVKRYEAYLNDPEMRPLRQQMEVDLRRADAERAGREGMARDAREKAAAAQRERDAEFARQHRDPEPGILPAVASAAPGGVDSTKLSSPRYSDEYKGKPHVYLLEQQWNALLDEFEDGKAKFHIEKDGFIRVESNIAGEFYTTVEELDLMQIARAQGIQHVDLEVISCIDAGRQIIKCVGRKALERIAEENAKRMGSKFKVGSTSSQQAVAAESAVKPKVVASAPMMSESSGVSSLETLNLELQSYLGTGYRTITNKSGDKVFLSKDGTKRVRFDVKNPHGDRPHMHIEKFVDGDFVDATSIHRIKFREVK